MGRGGGMIGEREWRVLLSLVRVPSIYAVTLSNWVSDGMSGKGRGEGGGRMIGEREWRVVSASIR